MRHIYDKFQFYIKAMIGFLIFITIFLSAFGFVYFQTTRQLKTDAVNRTLTAMQDGADEINDNFLRYYNTYQTLLSISEIQVLARGDVNGLQPSDYSQLIKLQKRLTEIWTFNEYITDIMLVFDAESPFALSTLYTLDDFKNAYASRLFYCVDRPYDEFMALIRNNANSSVTINKFSPALRFDSLQPTMALTPQGSKILFSYKLSIPYKNFEVYAVMFLDTAGIQRKLLNSSDSALAIANGENILSASGFPADASNILPTFLEKTYYDQATRNTVLRVNTDNLSLSFQTILNDQDIVRQISRFSTMLYMLLAVFIAISVVVLVFAAIYVIKPLQNLFNRFYDSYIKAPRLRGRAFAHIDHEIDMISSSNAQINSKLTNWEPMIRVNLLGRLLRGEVLNDEEQRMILQFLNLGSSQDVWQVAVIGEIGSQAVFASGNEPADISQVVLACLPEAMICRLRSRYFAVFTRGRPAGDDTWQAQWNYETLYRRILEQLNQNDGAAFAIGIGTSRTDLFDLHQSFKEAERAYREADIWKRPDVVLYQTLGQNCLTYNLPYQEIDKLYNLLSAGDAAQAGALLAGIADRVFRINRQNRPYYYICKQFYYEVLGVLLRVSARKDLSPILSNLLEYDEKRSLDEMLQQFQQAFEFTAEAIRSGGSHISAHVLFLDMQNYIKTHYNNQDLSLKLLSQVFSLTEPYLSICFKNECGMNFFNYLENLRLSEAEKLLLESRLPVKDIACSIGYSTPNTFFKAFKRKHGITPSAWQEMQEIK